MQYLWNATHYFQNNIWRKRRAKTSVNNTFYQRMRAITWTAVRGGPRGVQAGAQAPAQLPIIPLFLLYFRLSCYYIRMIFLLLIHEYMWFDAPSSIISNLCRHLSGECKRWNNHATFSKDEWPRINNQLHIICTMEPQLFLVISNFKSKPRYATPFRHIPRYEQDTTTCGGKIKQKASIAEANIRQYTCLAL